MSDYPMLISNKLHSFRNFIEQRNDIFCELKNIKLLNWRTQGYFS